MVFYSLTAWPFINPIAYIKTAILIPTYDLFASFYDIIVSDRLARA